MPVGKNSCGWEPKRRWLVLMADGALQSPGCKKNKEFRYVQFPLLKRVATVLAALHLLLVAQVPLAQAAMIGTPEVVAEHQQQVDRQQLLTMLDDQDVQKKLEAMGVERDQVEKRINGLTAAELAQFNQQLDQAPAGQALSA